MVVVVVVVVMVVVMDAEFASSPATGGSSRMREC